LEINNRKQTLPALSLTKERGWKKEMDRVKFPFFCKEGCTIPFPLFCKEGTKGS